MSRCRAIVKKNWYVLEHQCRFPAQPNGFCKRHDPERHKKALKRQEARLIQALVRVERELMALSRPKGVIGAPEWLKQRMAKLAKLPPQTLEKVRAQFRASEESDLPPWLKKGGRMAV